MAAVKIFPRPASAPLLPLYAFISQAGRILEAELLDSPFPSSFEVMVGRGGVSNSDMQGLENKKVESGHCVGATLAW